MRITITMVLFGLCFTPSLMAQNEQDALNLSREEVTGSARTVAMGGAFTALGGDLSAIYTNPGGIAVFRANEFSISPSFQTNISNTNYYGNTNLDSRSNFNFSTLGVVGVKDLNHSGKWRSAAIGIGMHRTFNFHRSYTAVGTDVPSSLIDDYENILNENNLTPEIFDANNPPYPFDIYLAWNNYLLNPNGDSTGFVDDTGVMPINQNHSVDESGAKRTTFFSAGGNYDDRLYIGAAVNLSRLQYNRSFRHNELIDPADTTTALEEFTYRYDEEISGYGVSASIGAIYRPITPLRIGLSVKTPTFYSLTIEYESKNTSVWEDRGVLESQSPQIGRYDFSLSTPLESSLGIAYIFGKYGLISADVEYVDYNSIRMQGISDSYNFTSEENAIKSQLQKALNLRVGAEYRITSFVSARAGYALYGNPYKAQLKLDGGFELYSVGMGYRNDDFFIDGSYQYKVSKNQEYFYGPNLVEQSTQAFANHRFTITTGLRF